MSEDPALLSHLSAWGDVVDDANYYEILGVPTDADGGRIKEAYRAFALAFHPDRHHGLDESAVELLSRIFHLGTEAYRALCRPELRLRYDMLLEQGKLRLPEQDLRAPTRPPEVALHLLARSAGAKLCAERAQRFLDAGQLDEALAELQQALDHDSTNRPLAERLFDLEVAAYAHRDKGR